ncbi:hypothetical protein VP01_2194g3 [Puccinia sorghi]|uniref:Uncharacterized protein n=1 Tax=Puccinia sorghi TaxID=27349 RepID=A0A0L6VAW7_9BASI|nr:hypothetical protein VP01_2194g3 [Puccinia sorghi]
MARFLGLEGCVQPFNHSSAYIPKPHCIGKCRKETLTESIGHVFYIHYGDCDGGLVKLLLMMMVKSYRAGADEWESYGGALILERKRKPARCWSSERCAKLGPKPRGNLNVSSPVWTKCSNGYITLSYAIWHRLQCSWKLLINPAVGQIILHYLNNYLYTQDKYDRGVCYTKYQKPILKPTTEEPCTCLQVKNRSIGSPAVNTHLSHLSLYPIRNINIVNVSFSEKRVRVMGVFWSGTSRLPGWGLGAGRTALQSFSADTVVHTILRSTSAAGLLSGRESASSCVCDRTQWHMSVLCIPRKATVEVRERRRPKQLGKPTGIQSSFHRSQKMTYGWYVHTSSFCFFFDCWMNSVFPSAMPHKGIITLLKDKSKNIQKLVSNWAKRPIAIQDTLGHRPAANTCQPSRSYSPKVVGITTSGNINQLIISSCSNLLKCLMYSGLTTNPSPLTSWRCEKQPRGMIYVIVSDKVRLLRDYFTHCGVFIGEAIAASAITAADSMESIFRTFFRLSGLSFAFRKGTGIEVWFWGLKRASGFSFSHETIFFCATNMCSLSVFKFMITLTCIFGKQYEAGCSCAQTLFKEKGGNRESSFRITKRQKIHSFFPGCSVQRVVTRECLLLELILTYLEVFPSEIKTFSFHSGEEVRGGEGSPGCVGAEFCISSYHHSSEKGSQVNTSITQRGTFRISFWVGRGKERRNQRLPGTNREGLTVYQLHGFSFHTTYLVDHNHWGLCIVYFYTLSPLFPLFLLFPILYQKNPIQFWHLELPCPSTRRHGFLLPHLRSSRIQNDGKICVLIGSLFRDRSLKRPPLTLTLPTLIEISTWEAGDLIRKFTSTNSSWRLQSTPELRVCGPIFLAPNANFALTRGIKYDQIHNYLINWTYEGVSNITNLQLETKVTWEEKRCFKNCGFLKTPRLHKGRFGHI